MIIGGILKIYLLWMEYLAIVGIFFGLGLVISGMTKRSKI
jgi:hypothetical protein